MKGGGNKDELNRTGKRLCNEVCLGTRALIHGWDDKKKGGAFWMIRYPME